MNVSKQAAFYYRADANAFGGILKQPLERIVSTCASVSLAPAGGFSASHSERYSVDGLVSVDAAHVHVSGTEHKEHSGHRSTATAIVEGLNILEVVTADRIVAQVSLLHPYGNGPVQVTLLGSQFVNLQVNGIPVHPKLDPRIFGGGKREENTLDAPIATDLLKVAEAQYAEGAEVRRVLVNRFGKRFDYADPWTDLEETGTALCTILQPLAVEAPGQSYGHVIHLPGFGNIFLGELLINRFAAELTMLRVEMGCVAEGTVSACSARPNGRWAP